VGLYRYEGKLLFRNGALATSENCCCQDPCDLLDCAVVCEQLGTLANPAEGQCPPGWISHNGWCATVDFDPGCETCNAVDRPAPAGLENYTVTCVGVCCPDDTGYRCGTFGCCDAPAGCDNPPLVEDVSGLDEHGQGTRRFGYAVPTMPGNTLWAPGYPYRLLTGCYFFWRSSISCSVIIDAGSPTSPRISLGIGVDRYTVWRWSDGEWSDATGSVTTNGPIFINFDSGATGAESAFGGVPCPEGCIDREFLEPTINCNEFP